MPKPPRVYQTPAIVLRQRKLGDADKIVTLYSAEFGKLDAVAKGVRRITSRLAGHVEPLNHGSYLLAHGRNLDIVTQAQTIETFQALRCDLDRLSRALYAAELLDRATEERAESFALYRLLLDTLRRLSLDNDLDLALRFFEMSLLDHLGYRPQVDVCVVCRSALSPGGNKWAPGLGGALCADCRPQEEVVRTLSPDGLALMQALQAGNYRDVSDLQTPPELANEIEGHLRATLHYALERDIQSAAFLDAVRRPARLRSARSGAGSDTSL